MTTAVLLIEDEAQLARNVKLFLERKGFEVRLALTAELGLAALDEFRPDAVVLDFNLPGMNGLEALARIRSIAPEAVVVMVTGHGSEQVAVDAMKAGAYDYLVKPVALDKLKLVLERAVQEKRRSDELDYRRRRDARRDSAPTLIGNSTAMQRLRDAIARILAAESGLPGGTPPTVLITGETGTGKELVARALHFEGRRRDAPFVEINCASIPLQLLEAELFGFERGAFTDARERKIGLIEAADGGTLFLDEIGECDLGLQAKLLKLLEDRKVRRLGSVRERQVDVRIVAATNRDLQALVREGRLRSDLYFRLNTLQLRTPPLRERGRDILMLAESFLRTRCAHYGRPEMKFTPDAAALLEAHEWPGNVRELGNVVEQCVIMTQGAEVGADDLVQCGLRRASPSPELPSTLPEFERRLLAEALEANRWNVTKAARQLGVSRDTLRYRMQKFGIK